MVSASNYRLTMPPKNNKFKSDDVKWSERTARLKHRFLVLRKLGQGTYGKVQLALNKETNEEVAIKTIKKAKIESEEDMLRIRREIHIMTSIRHPHIIHINEVFETRQKIVLVMQYASGGELYDYLGCHNTLPENETRRIFRQIASAIYYCHKNKICHRDLKLENILLDEEGNAQIADFGLSNIFDERRRMNTFCGSPLYASPEIVKGIPYTGPEVDCWSLGVLLYILIYGTMPFDGRNFKVLVSQISEGRYNEPINKSSASGLIRRLLTPEISRRATISNVCEDEWVNQGYAKPLYKVAEEMSAEALLKTNKLRLTNFLLEKATKTDKKTSVSQTKSTAEQQKVVKSVVIGNEESGNSDVNNISSHKATLYEQMLSYDVGFVLNKLLVAVESAGTRPKLKTNVLIPSKDYVIPAFKHCQRNGENNFSPKIESAYVIPIFEVTSVIPKSKFKTPINQSIKEKSQSLSGDNTAQNDHASARMEHRLKKEMKDMYDIKNNLSSNPLQQLKQSAVAINDTLSQNCAERTPQQTNIIFNSNQELCFVNESTESKLSRVKTTTNDENNIRTSSNKLKRIHENHLFGRKQFGPFFRNKNHSLSLARIFSMKYEELILKTLNAPERKQRSPGKIVIPSTFDPSASSNHFHDKKEVIVFPTVSVSENKEKIEKKIERIKKAALNMDLIIRSNSENRLKIQKYLKSQTKKIQDLVHDEHRSIAGSIENINVSEMFPAVPDSYFNKFNLINIKHHNKKMNFMYLNALNSYNPFTINVPPSEKWKLTDSEDIVFGQRQNLKFFGIVKSKSDIQFSPLYENNFFNEPSYAITDLTDKNCQCSLNVPYTECQLLRSASDSQALFKTAQDIYVYEEDSKTSEENTHNKRNQIRQQILKEYFCLEAEKLNDQFQFKMPYSKKQSPELESKKLNFTNACKNEIINFKDVLVGEKRFSRSKSTDYFAGYKKMDDFFNVKRSTSTCSLSYREVSGKVKRRNEVFLIRPMPNEQVNENSCSLTNDILEILEKQKLLKQSTTSASSECNELKMFPSLNHTRRSSADSDTGFEDYFWTLNDDQENILSQCNNHTKFLSSPNLCLLRLGKKTDNELVNESKSVDCLSSSRNERYKTGYVTLANQSPSFVKKFNAQPLFNRRILNSDDSAFYDFPSNDTDRTKSISEDTLAHFEGDELLRRTENERKLSLPPMIVENQKKSQFLSKFLNDLENRNQFPNSKNKSLNQIKHSKSSLAVEERSKQEKRSQSFLQLLSLKRIHEAEKELERAERSRRMEAENDESGSLLEALKTHGYKGVISQLFQGTEDDSLENLRNPKSSYFKRQISSDMPYYSPVYYETSPFLPISTYEDEDLDISDVDKMQSFYDMYPDFRQNYQKQLVYNWLRTNGNSDHPSPYRTDPELTNDDNTQRPEGLLRWSKQRSTSFDDEFTSFESSKDQCTNGAINNESSRSRENSLNDVDYTINNKPDRNVLSRTSSVSEDEKESVQDRIWRKSFYSRFNNSVLLRKGRPTSLKSQFSTDGRTGSRDNYLTSFGMSSREGTAFVQGNGHKSSEFKTIHQLTKPCSSNGITAGSVKVKSGKYVPLKEN